MKEIWKDIPNYEGLYQVSNLGNVRRIKKWCGNKNTKIYKEDNTIIKKHITNKPKYYFVVLSKNSIRKNVRIHRLVAQAFIPNPNNLPQVNHKDGNKLNNCVNNLEWCTNSYNISHAIKNGLWEHRSDNVRKSVLQYDKNYNFIKKYNSLLEAEKETGVSNGNISNCCKSKSKTAGGYIWEYSQT